MAATAKLIMIISCVITKEPVLHYSLKVKVKLLSLSDSLRPHGTVAHQAPPSMGFSRQEYWSGLPFPSPGNLPNPGIKPGSPALQAEAFAL